MAVCVSLINMKGGVGKTTLATQIAWYATVQMDKKVLLVDLDPQANATSGLGVRPQPGHSLYGVLIGEGVRNAFDPRRYSVLE